MCPDVSCLCMYPYDGLETLRGGKGWPVSKVEKVVVLKPLRQVGEVDDLPGLELVPDGNGELFGLLGSVHHQLSDGEVAELFFNLVV